MKTQTQKFYQLTNSNKNEFYSLIKVGGKITFLKTMKLGRYALAYSLDEAKFYKIWLQRKENIFCMLIPKK
jgi:hypothetical protein